MVLIDVYLTHLKYSIIHRHLNKYKQLTFIVKMGNKSVTNFIIGTVIITGLFILSWNYWHELKRKSLTTKVKYYEENHLVDLIETRNGDTTKESTDVETEVYNEANDFSGIIKENGGNNTDLDKERKKSRSGTEELTRGYPEW